MSGSNKLIRLFFALLILLAVIIPVSLVAQITQPHRYELIQKGSDDYFTIIPLKEEGLCLLRHKDKYNAGKRVWEFILLDTALTEKKVITFELDNRNNFVGYEYSPGVVYFLYRTGETNKNTLQLVAFSTSGEEKGRYEIKAELDFKLTHFIKAGDRMILGGYVNKDPVILIYEMATNLIKVVPGFFQKDNELVDLRTNENQTFNVVLLDRSTRAEKKMIFRTFDQQGEMLLEDIVPIEDKKSLQTNLTSTLEREELMVVGTWGDRQAKQSAGFFSLKVDPFTEQTVKYFDLANSLEHYLDDIKPKRAERIRKASEADSKEGRNPDYANYIMPFRLQEHKDAFLMLAEVYNPVSASGPNSNSLYGPYGAMAYGNPYFYNPGYYYPNRMYRPFPYTGNNAKNSDEIKTTQAVVVAFDGGGNVLWDYGMKISDVNRLSLEQVSDFYYADKKLFLLYRSKEAELHAKIVSIVDGEGGVIKTKVELSDPADEFRLEKEQEGGVRQWVANSFYVWGYQTIRNVNKNDRSRDVFYINKVVVK